MAEVCRKHGISEPTFYAWKAKFGGMSVSDAKRLKQLEDENAKLKKLLAEAMLDNAVLKVAATPIDRTEKHRHVWRGTAAGASPWRPQASPGHASTDDAAAGAEPALVTGLCRGHADRWSAVPHPRGRR